MNRNGLLPFGWYGGKYGHLDWLLPLLPNNVESFIDVFGGSGTVILNRPRNKVEILNDLDRDLITFFRLLRNDTDALLKAITMTPWSREEHRIACLREPDISDLERARRFFIRCIQTHGGKAQNCRPSGWSYSVRDTGQYKTKTAAWRDYPARLAAIAQRLLMIQIECLPAIDLIPRYDHEAALFYCDPPYVHSTRADTSVYAGEMSDDKHRELAEALQGIKGKAAISGYRSALYDEIFEGWHRTDGNAKVPPSAQHGKTRKVVRQECLWTNYDPAKATRTPTLPLTAP